MVALIYQLPQQAPGTTDVLPAFKFMVSGDSLEIITKEGYLNSIDLQSNPVSSGDILQVLYDYNLSTKKGKYGAFSVNIDNGIISLSTAENADSVSFIPPVTGGNFASWYGALGEITDYGYRPTNLSLTQVVMLNGSASTNNLPSFDANNGSLKDSGFPSSGLINRNIANAMGNAPAALFFLAATATEVLGVVTINSQCGIITTESLTTASGGTHVIRVNNPYAQGLLKNYISLSLLTEGTNTSGNAVFLAYTSGANHFDIVITNANTAALNGTLQISFWIAR